MDEDILVEDQKEAGKVLVEALKSAAFDVTAACWLLTDETDRWYLYIATKEFEGGEKKAYTKLHRILNDHADIMIDRFEVRLVSNNDPIVSEIEKLYQKYVAPLATRFKNREFAGRSIVGGYIYPPATK